jgi:hypothetical protein
MQEVIKVLVCEPMKKPEVRTISNNLEAQQRIVGGYIEVAARIKDIVLICNEEGKLEGLPYNKPLPRFETIPGIGIRMVLEVLPTDFLVGSVFFTKIDDDGECISLEESEIGQLLELWEAL